MTAAPLRVGFVGAGFMGQVHSRAARSARASLAGIVSSTPEKSAAAAEALGFDRAYDSADELIADPTIDVIHVLTPNASHLPLAHAAIAAGKHVVCEKPLATSAADARALASAANAAGVTATVPFVYRFHPMVREARARVRSGEVGALSAIQGSYQQDWLLEQGDDNWRVDDAQGGRSRAFADIGSHLCDAMEFITGERITRVSARKRTMYGQRAATGSVSTEDLVAVLFETASGAVGTLLVSQVAPGRKNRLHLEISGASESLVFDQENPELLWIGKRRGSELLLRDDTLSADALRLSVLPPGHPLGVQDGFNAFVADTYAAIAGASPEGLPTFDDGVRAAELTDAVIDAAISGNWHDV